MSAKTPPYFHHIKAAVAALALLSFCFVSYSQAEITLPKLLSEGAILQRDNVNLLWGWAKEGEVVKAKLDGTKLGTATTKNGEWRIEFKGLPAGGPHQIIVEGENRISLNDIYFGDVWVASGQSNMQTPMSRVEEMYPQEVTRANYPLIRQFTVPRIMRFDKPSKDLSGGEWEKTTPESVLPQSAVAYFFAKKIHLDEKVPVGILSSNFGGSPAESWLSEEALIPYKEAYKRAKSLQDAEYLQSLKDADQIDMDTWFNKLNDSDLGSHESIPWYKNSYKHSNWPTLNMPSLWADEGIEPMNGIVWFKKTLNLPKEADKKAALLRLGTLVDADTAYINGIEVGKTGYRYPPRRYQVKENILKTGINTLTLRMRVDSKGGEFVADKPYYLQVGDKKYDLKGPWHYKIATTVDAPPTRRYTPWSEPLGCYNGMLAPLLNTRIKGVIWYQGESNTARPSEYRELFSRLIRHWREQWQQGDFPFIFAQLPNFGAVSDEAGSTGWPETRFAQFQTLRDVKNTAMAVNIDVGEWNDLHPLDKKSVGERLALGAQALAYGKNELVYSGPLYKSMSAKGKKLSLHFDFAGSGLINKGSEALSFFVAGEDGIYHRAKSKIKKDRVIVWSKKVKKPQSVRYAWAPSPIAANLYNKEGLPASPFEAKL